MSLLFVIILLLSVYSYQIETKISQFQSVCECVSSNTTGITTHSQRQLWWSKFNNSSRDLLN